MLAPLRISAQATLLTAERDGERCAGPVLMAGFVVGFGVIELATGALNQTSRFSLQLLVLLVLQLIGPILVSVLAMALLLPRWLERVVQQGQRAWRQSVPTAGLLGLLLMLLFFIGAIVGRVLVTPRADLLRETTDLLSGIRLLDLRQQIIANPKSQQNNAKVDVSRIQITARISAHKPRQPWKTRYTDSEASQ